MACKQLPHLLSCFLHSSDYGPADHRFNSTDGFMKTLRLSGDGRFDHYEPAPGKEERAFDLGCCFSAILFSIYSIISGGDF